MKTHCKACSKQFRHKPSKSPKYCSRPCYDEARRNKRYAGYVTTNGDYFRYTARHPTPFIGCFGMRPIRLHLAEKCAGGVERVHHVDGDKKNNSLSNVTNRTTAKTSAHTGCAVGLS